MGSRSEPAPMRWRLQVLRGTAPRGSAGNPAEHSARHKAGAARIVEIENATDELACGVQPRDGTAVSVNDASLGVNLQPAKRKSDAAGHGVSLERRCVYGVGPVRFWNWQSFRAPAILNVRIELNTGIHRFVIIDDGCEGALWINVLQFLHQLLERIRAHLGHALDTIFVPQHGNDFVVEYLPRELPGLNQDHAAVFGIGVVAKVGALIYEAIAVGVDHDTPRIGVLLKSVSDRKVAEFRRVAVPPDRMATRPIASRHRADIQRHLDAIAGIKRGATDLCKLPTRAEIAGTHLRICLEAAGREHDAFCGDLNG